jgi:YtkA-like
MNESRQHHFSLRHRWIAVVGFAIALLASGCGETAGGPAKVVTQQQMVGPLTIALEAPERPQLLAEQDVVVTLMGQGGQTIDGAEVWLVLIMPTMPMRTNEPDATPAGNGRYRATAIFTMAGTWNLEVHATVGGQEHVALFHVQTS